MAITVDLGQGELHNISIKSGKLSVRECFINHSEFTDLTDQFGSDVVYGFSVEDPNTTEIFHYLFLRNSAQLLTCVVASEEYQVMNYTNLGNFSGELVLTHAVLNQEVHVNGPGLSVPFYGLIGSSLLPAVKVLSRNEVNTPTIDVPIGLVTTFGDRMAIAQYNTVYFSDPGFRFRTFTGFNTITVPSKIYGLFQANNGVLFIVTAQDIYYITRDALGQGQAVTGFLGNVKGYEANDYRSAVNVGSAVFTIGNQAINVINGQTVGTMEIIKFDRKRYLSEVVGDSNLKEGGEIWQLNNGFVMNSAGKLFVFDNENKVSSWMYANDGTSITIVGILKDRGGRNLFLTNGNGVLDIQGTGQDIFASDSHPVGFSCVSLDSEPRVSELVRFITTVSDNAGLTQQVAIRGSSKSRTTPVISGQNNIVSGSNWNQDNYSSFETKSRRHGFAVRTDDISFEVGIKGATALIGSVSIDTEPNQDKYRP